MQTERAELYFQQGGSDKVYHLKLEQENDQWSARARWGRRGSSLQNDVKANGIVYEETKRAYDRVRQEKMGKGYQLSQASTNGDATISSGCPPQKNTPVTHRNC
jgi:bifunctional non-homologous end joining protein LigD